MGKAILEYWCLGLRKNMSFPPRPILADLLHGPHIADMETAPAPLEHHRYYGQHHHLGRTLDRVAAYDRVSKRVGEGVRSAVPEKDLSLHYHPRSWKTPAVKTDDVIAATQYQAENSTVSHMLKTYGRSHDLQNDLLHHSTYGMDYHVLPVVYQ